MCLYQGLGFGVCMGPEWGNSIGSKSDTDTALEDWWGERREEEDGKPVLKRVHALHVATLGSAAMKLSNCFVGLHFPYECH